MSTWGVPTIPAMAPCSTMYDPEEKCIAMVLNYIWIAFFLIAFVVASVQLAMGNTEVFPAIVGSTFDSARTAFDISLGLTGVLSLWMGIMKIGEQGGIVGRLARLLSPLMVRLFPEVPAEPAEPPSEIRTSPQHE